MAGTLSGGLKAAQSNKERHGADFYKKIGSKGGKLGTTGGFASHKECNCDLIAGTHFYQRCSGVKGGTISRRSKNDGSNEAS